MREGRTQEAYQYLGEAIHMVQDLTVPQHATDCYGLPHHRHQDYEAYADTVMRENRYVVTTAYPGDPARTTYFPDILLSDYAEAAAQASAERIDEVSGIGAVVFDNAMIDLVPLAQQLTAGILHKFHEKWQTEPYSAIKLTVHSAEALDRPDPIQVAELFVALNVIEPDEYDGEWEYRDDFRYEDFETGYFGDQDRVTPGEYLGYDVWTFPYTSETVRSSEIVDMILGLYDSDDPATPHRIDIDPSSDWRRMWLNVNLRTGDISRFAGRDFQPLGRIGERIVSVGNDSTITWTHGGGAELNLPLKVSIFLPVN